MVAVFRPHSLPWGWLRFLGSTSAQAVGVNAVIVVVYYEVGG